MSIKKSTRMKFGIGAAAVAILSLVIASFSLPVFAKDDAVAKKAILYGIYKTCYMGNKMVSPVRSNEFRDIWSIAKSEGSFVLPTEWYNQYSANCSQLIQNPAINSDFAGITSLTGISIPSSSAGSDKINSFLTGMGYTKEAGAKGKCATYSYAASGDPSDVETITMCAGVDSQGRITDDQVTVSYSDYAMGMVEFEIDEPGVVDIDCSQVFGHGGCGEHAFTKGETKFSDLVGAIYADLQEHRSGAVCGPLGCSWQLQAGAPITDQGDVQATFRITSMNDAGDKAVKYLSKNAYANSNALKLTEKERISLLQGYMQDYYRVEIYGCNLKGDDADIAKGAGYIKATTNLKSGSGYQECWVKATKNQSNSVAGFNNSNYFDGTMMTFDKVVSALNKAAKDQTKDNTVVSPTEGGTVEPSAESGEGGDSDDVSPCSKAGASLGWIICPVVQMVGEAANGIYGYIEENYLQMRPDFVSDQGTRDAWGIFRGFANIVFVIVLIVIIVSQITGFGVNNYGIKKMLPTIIVMAVLVNVSFFLCELAVDISNIVGYSGKEIFTDIGSRVGGGGSGDASLGSMAWGLALTFLEGGGAVIGLVVAYNTIEFWILPLLLMLLVALISIIFFFILLGVRQAGIIILITLAPLAIICYALPNTKKLFERWWKIFFALLLVYPICGILMGGGQFASRLLLRVGSSASGDGMKFSYAFVAVLIQAVPLFFVPSILKSSMTAMGSIGAKISNFGRGLSKTATGAIRKSEGYKDARMRLGGQNAQRMLNRSSWNQRHRILGKPGRMIDAAGEKIRKGNGRIAEMANNSYNRRQNRRNSAVLAQNLANRDRGDFYTQRHIDEVANDYTSTWDKDGTFASEKSTSEKLEAALNDLRVDSKNIDARARFTAAMNSLNTSDAGRKYVDSVMNKAAFEEAQAGHTENDGHHWAANAIRKAAGKEYKAKTPAAFANIMDYASRENPFDVNNFKRDDIFDDEGKVKDSFYVRKDNQYKKADTISAEQFMDADDSYRQDIIRGLTSGAITGAERDNVIAQAREITTNPSLKPKGDVARDMHTIANADYAPPSVGGPSSNTSASTVDGASVSRMANASQGELDRIVRGIEEGRIGTENKITGTNDRAEMANVAEATLNAANAGTVSLSQESAQKLNRIRALDGRAEIPYQLRVQHNPNAAPVPGGFEENSSGIVIPRNGQSGDLTGSQIRDFGRQMDRFNGNNGRNGNNNNNGGGPTIIRP